MGSTQSILKKYFPSDVFEDFCNPTVVIGDKSGWGRETYDIPKEGQGYDTRRPAPIVPPMNVSEANRK